MRVLIGLFLICRAFAYDAVLFSNDQELSSDVILEALINSASSEHPLIFLVEPDFTLGFFSRYASVYQSSGKASPLAALVKSSKYSTQEYLDNSYHVPNALPVAKTEDFKTGEAIYLVSAEDWNQLEKLSIQLLGQVNTYTAVVTNSEAISLSPERVKRLTVDDFEDDERDRAVREANDFQNGSLPLSLPPHNRTDIKTIGPAVAGLGCLFYLEGITVIASKQQGDVPSAYRSAAATYSGENGTFSYSDSMVSCVTSPQRWDNGVFSFEIMMHQDVPVSGTNIDGIQFSLVDQVIHFKVTFEEDYQRYWSLTKFELIEPLKIDKATGGSKPGFIDQAATAAPGNASGIGYIGLNGVAGYAWGCGDSAAAWFDTDNKIEGKKVWIGLAFHNMQVQLRNVNASQGFYFDMQVADCVGTFSTGSLMGIVTMLVLLTVFIFGFLMLNSVQTMDRFDDPKQKQILINVRE